MNFAILFLRVHSKTRPYDAGFLGAMDLLESIPVWTDGSQPEFELDF